MDLSAGAQAMTGLTTTASHLVAPSQFIGPGRLEQAGTVGASSGLASRCSALQEHPRLLEENQLHRTLPVSRYISSSSALGRCDCGR